MFVLWPGDREAGHGRNTDDVRTVEGGVIHRQRTEQIGKAVLLALTVVLMASMGGAFLALPVLIPAHLWAARRSRSMAAKIGWSVLPAVSVGMVAWAAVYVVVGEAWPVIWALPAVAFISTLAMAAHAARPAVPIATERP